MENTLSDIVAFIKLSKGYDLGRYDKGFLVHNLNNRMAKAGIRSLNRYFRFLREHTEETDKLLRSFHVTYSEFFRDPVVFSILWKWVLPSFLLRQENTGKTEIRVWSAATAAGQEAYSLDMLFDEDQQLYPDKNV